MANALHDRTGRLENEVRHLPSLPPLHDRTGRLENFCAHLCLA